MNLFCSRVFLVFLLILPSIFLCGQNITLVNQTQVDTFNFTEVGNLTISGENITNLDGLSELEIIRGNLFIRGNTNLSSISILNLTLVDVGALVIESNANLTTINLPELIRVGNGTVRPVLGIESENKSFFIRNNPKLASLESFQKLVSVGNNFGISGNPLLQSISGFGDLASVGRYMTISSNAELNEISGFIKMASIGVALTISSNALLTEISGFNTLDYAWAITIRSNPVLNKLELVSIDTIGGNLLISSNAALNSINFPNLKIANAGFLKIDGNANLTSINFPELIRVGNGTVRPVLGIESENKSFFIRNNPKLASLEGFQKLVSVGNNFGISGNALLQNISGFGDLVRVGRYMTISSNAELNEISGFTKMASIGVALTISSNALLTEISGFNTLDYAWAITISSNPVLNKLELVSIDTIGGNLLISSNAALNSINFPKLKIANAGFLKIDGNANLTSINFPELIRVGNGTVRPVLGFESENKSFFIRNNQKLESIASFQKLVSVGNNFGISGNGELRSVSGFRALNGIGRNFTLTSNSKLTNCCGFSNLLKNSITSVGAGINIRNNPSECSNQVEIVAVCVDTVLVSWFIDADEDGFGNINRRELAFNQPIGFVKDSTDCNDSDNTIYPNAPELGDSKDNDCNNIVDDNFMTWYYDRDGDSFGDPDSSLYVVNQPSGFVDNNDDCDDNNPDITIIGAMCDDGDDTTNRDIVQSDCSCRGESMDNLCADIGDADGDGICADLDCDDSPETGVSCSEGCQTFYRDADGDTFGSKVDSVRTCIAPVGYVDNNMDCDDTDENKGLDCSSGDCNLTNELLAYYPFNGNANDESGDKDGVVNGAVLTTNRFNEPDAAYLFDGINDFIQVDFPFQEKEFTISTWINIQSYNCYGGIIDGFSNQWEFVLDCPNGSKLELAEWTNSVTYNDRVGNSILNLNEWYQASLVVNNNTAKLFLNGIEDASFVLQGNISDNVTQFFIGVSQSGSPQYFNGKIDDICIYNRAFSDTKIKELFECEGGERPLCNDLTTQTFTSQAQLDTFVCDCEKTINGDLIINGDNITDLSNLSCIKTVTGNVLIGDSLSIPSNDSLQTLNGLGGIMTIGGDLVICNNPMLQDLDGFSSLMEVGGNIQVKNCRVIEYIRFVSLTRVGGSCLYFNLPRLLYIGSNGAGIEGGSGLTFFGGGITYWNLPSLTWITGFGGLTEILGDVYFIDVPQIPSLISLKTIIRLRGCLHLNGVTIIENFDGLESLQSIDGDIRIIGNDRISDLSQLGNLVNVTGSLIIRDNDNLVTVEGLRNLTTVSDTLMITNNGMLETCCDILDLLQNGGVQGVTMISGNQPSCNSQADIELDCADMPPPPPSCEFNNPLTDLPFLVEIIADPDPCYLEIRRGAYNGEPVFIIINQNICEVEPEVFLATEIDYLIYDCSGNLICTGGLVIEPIDCEDMSIEGTAIWTKPPTPGTDNDEDGYTIEEGDCDDNNPNVYPDAPEISCNGIDENCDGIDNVIEGSNCPEDKDGDTFTEEEGDCDDNNADINPNATEIQCNGIDENCNGMEDDVPVEGCSIDPTYCPEFMANIGEPCDDNNPDTFDEWLEEGCLCVGRPINPDVCDVEITHTDNSITVLNLNDAHNKFYLYDKTFSNLIDSTCSYWTGCEGDQTIDNLVPGIYGVQIQSYNEDWTIIVCDKVEFVEIKSSTDIDACESIDIRENNGTLTIDNLPTLNTIVDVYDPAFNSVHNCIGDCGTAQTIENLAVGDYLLRIKVYDVNWQPLCEIEERIKVTSTQIIILDREPEILTTSSFTRQQLSVFPNPVINQLQIGVGDFMDKETDVLIYNMLGKVVYEAHFDQLTVPTIRIDTKAFAEGMHIISLRQEGRAISKKFIRSAR